MRVEKKSESMQDCLGICISHIYSSDIDMDQTYFVNKCGIKAQLHWFFKDRKVFSEDEELSDQ